MNELTKSVFDKIDELSDKYLNVLVDVCNIESKTEDKEGVDKVGDYFAAIASDLGYKIKKKEFERAGNVYSFTYNPDGEKKLISLSTAVTWTSACILQTETDSTSIKATFTVVT